MVRAWEMSTRESKSLRTIGAELGIGLATASRYVRKVEQAGEFIDLLDAADARVGQALRYREYLELLRARIDQGAKAELIIPVSMKVEDSLAKLHGTNAQPQTPDDGDLASTLNLELLNELRKVQRHAAETRQRNGAAPKDEYGDAAR